jgi:hypothetical protein
VAGHARGGEPHPTRAGRARPAARRAGALTRHKGRLTPAGAPVPSRAEPSSTPSGIALGSALALALESE